MNIYYKNNLKAAYLVIEGTEQENEDYQIGMLQENKIPGLLSMHVRYVDNHSDYYYDISGMQSMQAKYEKEKLELGDMKRMIQDLLSAMQEAKKYMLDGEKILMEPEYIFCEKEHFRFVYYPACEQNLKEEFHKLTEFFVREVDYKDKEGVHLAYTMHKATMEEHYSIEKIIENLEKEETVPKIHYVERMEKQEEENLAVAEKTEFWEPVRRLLERKKKEKWGYWDEVHIEEEDL